MRFENPQFLVWLWLAVPLAVLLVWARRASRRKAGAFAQGALFDALTQSVNGRAEGRKHFLLLLVFVFSVLALARPQWGFQWREVKRRGLDILIAVDTSRSMLTQDVKPDRLDRTKWAIRDFLKKVKGDRVGLIAFSGEAFMACPLTVDYNGFLLSLEDLDTQTIPRGGTNITAAIDEALKQYQDVPSKYKAVIIVTDGENLEGDPLAAARRAKEKGVRIYCVGIGTREGELIQVTNDAGEKSFLKDEQGNFVKSRLNEKLLQDIALTTGGVYVRSAGAQFGLDLIYDKELSKLERRDIQEKMEKRYYERFQWPLSLGFVFLLFYLLVPARRRGL